MRTIRWMCGIKVIDRFMCSVVLLLLLLLLWSSSSSSVLGMEVGLSPGEFVLDGDPAPSPKRG